MSLPSIGKKHEKVHAQFLYRNVGFYLMARGLLQEEWMAVLALLIS